MVYYVTSPTYQAIITSVLRDSEQIIAGGENISEMYLNKYIKEHISNLSGVDILIIDLSCCLDLDAEIVSSLETLKVMYGQLRVVLLATQIMPGDELLIKSVQMGIYDIITATDFAEIKDELTRCVIEGMKYRDAIRYLKAEEDDKTGKVYRQVDYVTKKLQVDYQMSVKRFTAEEDLKDRENIKKYFSEGQYQVITAIKCLDEGVNIPGIKTAFIMSSSRNPKEFVQRRGRLLRKSKNKKKAVIYDFITLPREPDNIRQNDIEEDKTIIVGEVARMQEFGRLSDNPEDTDYLINQIMEAYEYYFDAEEEMQRMEEYYGE